MCAVNTALLYTSPSSTLRVIECAVVQNTPWSVKTALVSLSPIDSDAFIVQNCNAHVTTWSRMNASSAS